MYGFLGQFEREAEPTTSSKALPTTLERERYLCAAVHRQVEWNWMHAPEEDCGGVDCGAVACKIEICTILVRAQCNQMKYEYLRAQTTMPTTPTTLRRQTYRKLWPEEPTIWNSSSPVAYKLTESAAPRAKRQLAGRMRTAAMVFQVIKRRKWARKNGRNGAKRQVACRATLNKPYLELKARTYVLRAGMGGKVP